MEDILSAYENVSEGISDDLFVQLPAKEGMNIKVNTPMKRALRTIANRTGFSMSDIIRHVLMVYTDTLYPGFTELFNKYYREEIDWLEDEQEV